MRLENFDNYSISGDVSTIAVSVVILILLMTSYVSRIRSLWIFLSIIGQLIVAAAINIAYHTLLFNGDPATFNLIYTLRIVYNALLFDIFFLFALYLTVVSEMTKQKVRVVAIMFFSLFVIIVGIDIVRAITGTGFRIT